MNIMAIVVHLWKTLQHSSSVSNMSLSISMISNAALLEVPNHLIVIFKFMEPIPRGCLRTIPSNKNTISLQLYLNFPVTSSMTCLPLKLTLRLFVDCRRTCCTQSGAPLYISSNAISQLTVREAVTTTKIDVEMARGNVSYNPRKVSH